MCFLGLLLHKGYKCLASVAKFTSKMMHCLMSQNFPILPYFLQSINLLLLTNQIQLLSKFYQLSLLMLFLNLHPYPLLLYNNNNLLIIPHLILAFLLLPQLLLFHSCGPLHLHLPLILLSPLLKPYHLALPP